MAIYGSNEGIWTREKESLDGQTSRRDMLRLFDPEARGAVRPGDLHAGEGFIKSMCLFASQPRETELLYELNLACGTPLFLQIFCAATLATFTITSQISK